MQFIAINLRSLILALHVFSFLNGIETVDLSETFRQSFDNTTVLRPQFPIRLQSDEDDDLKFRGTLNANTITALLVQSTFQATKANESSVSFQLKFPLFNVSGSYEIINGIDGSEKFSGDSTFSLELENFTYNDTLPFEDGSLQLRPSDDYQKKSDYENLLNLRLNDLEYEESEDDISTNVIEAITESAKMFLARNNNDEKEELLIEIENALQILLQRDTRLNEKLSEL